MTAGPVGSGQEGHATGSGHPRRHGAAGFRTKGGDNSIPEYGSETTGSEREQGEASLEAYLVARAHEDWTRACSNMANAVTNQLEVLADRQSNPQARSCVGAFSIVSAPEPASERANPLIGGLAAFRVEGNNAFALFYGPGRQQYMMPMVLEAGDWKVNQINPIRWPIGAS